MVWSLTIELCVLKSKTMDKDYLCFLKVSGYIHPSKHHEFEQTINFVFDRLPYTCLERSLTIDISDSTHYHLFSLWQSESSMLKFKASHEFKFLKGAFQTLGRFEESMAGRWAETQLFELNHLDA